MVVRIGSCLNSVQLENGPCSLPPPQGPLFPRKELFLKDQMSSFKAGCAEAEGGAGVSGGVREEGKTEGSGPGPGASPLQSLARRRDVTPWDQGWG